MSELLLEKLSVADQPFAHAGVDYFRPLLVKLNKKSRANQAVAKRYGAIFTCLFSRALHIELVGDLYFMLAPRRFISRWGYTKSIVSDNGTEALQKLDNSRIKDDLNQRYIIWKFNPPCTSWMGGVKVNCHR